MTSSTVVEMRTMGAASNPPYLLDDGTCLCNCSCESGVRCNSYRHSQRQPRWAVRQHVKTELNFVIIQFPREGKWVIFFHQEPCSIRSRATMVVERVDCGGSQTFTVALGTNFYGEKVTIFTCSEMDVSKEKKVSGFSRNRKASF